MFFPFIRSYGSVHLPLTGEQTVVDHVVQERCCERGEDDAQHDEETPNNSNFPVSVTVQQSTMYDTSEHRECVVYIQDDRSVRMRKSERVECVAEEQAEALDDRNHKDLRNPRQALEFREVSRLCFGDYVRCSVPMRRR